MTVLLLFAMCTLSPLDSGLLKLDNNSMLRSNKLTEMEEVLSTEVYDHQKPKVKSNDDELLPHNEGKQACYRYHLEDEVLKLQQQLQKEIELHALLESALECRAETNSGANLPAEFKELLGSVALLEITVLKLEEETYSLRYQLSHERNQRRFIEYKLKQPTPSTSPSMSMAFEALEGLKKKEYSSLYFQVEDPLAHSLINDHTSNCHSSKDSMLNSMSKFDSLCEPRSLKETNASIIEHSGQSRRARKMSTQFSENSSIISKQGSSKEKKYMSLSQYPNRLSEEMVRCMRNIFIHLGDPEATSKLSSPGRKMSSPRSPLGHITTASSSFSESSSIFSFAKNSITDLQIKQESLGTENTFDPYNSCGKLRWADMGKYMSAIEVSWMSVGKEQLEYAADALRKFRLLVEQLSKVNPGCMTHDQKLAFWINVYNALMMHAYLAYGVPKSESKLFALMQKAAYTVGGYSFNAVSIEYIILKMKPPMHRPQMALILALHKFKVSEDQTHYAVDQYEPLLTFALSCGVYSSPAVRIFSAENIHVELKEAFHDYVCASVGVSAKGKLLVPKLLHCFAKGVIEENELINWLCQFLSSSQAKAVQNCISKRRQRFLGSRDYSVISFDSRFRYLFLSENEK